MTLPISTTTVSLLRYDDTTLQMERGDQADATRTAVLTGLAAHFSSPSGQQNVTGGGTLEQIDFVLLTDPADIHPTDHVLNETTQEEFVVVWTHSRPGLQLDHVASGVRLFVGEQAA